mgnify:CR=1 FL=1
MHNVGHHLQIEAIKETDPIKDLFARSAYNRYYYNIFLSVRTMLSEFDPKWSRTPHKDCPIILKETMKKIYKSAKKRAHKNNDTDLVKILDSAIPALHSLSEIMTKAGAIRITADYYPEERVNFTTANRFSLKNVDISEAHEWDQKIGILINTIRSAWKQINAN